MRENLHKSAMYSGEIAGVGPRYCPSIEDKFVRFADKPRHLLFLEPEGRNTNEYYINGLSTSLPFDVQLDLVHSIPGLEQATLLRPAYAVEYDFAPPTQMFPSLESRKVENLFLAGQINGTSGYEEAAGQGLIAGVNAVLKVRGAPPMIIQRHEAYIGVLIDDLVTKGTTEPYRMFTSRAEHRLLFNHGSAELRLMGHAKTHKLLSNSTFIKNISETKLTALPIGKHYLETNQGRRRLLGGRHSPGQKRGRPACGVFGRIQGGPSRGALSRHLSRVSRPRAPADRETEGCRKDQNPLLARLPGDPRIAPRERLEAAAIPANESRPSLAD